MEFIQTLIFLVLMVAVFYFLLIRPERKRRQQHQELVGSLKRGDKVITMGGLCGLIKKVDKDRIWLEVEDGMTLKVVRDCVVERERS